MMTMMIIIIIIVIVIIIIIIIIEISIWIPNSVEAQTFWRGIWSERKERHKDAEWLKDVKKELEQDEDQDMIDITKDKTMRVMRKMPNWKAPGPDNVQGYWLKNLTPLHDKLVVYLQDCLYSGGGLLLVDKGTNTGYAKG